MQFMEGKYYLKCFKNKYKSLVIIIVSKTNFDNNKIKCLKYKFLVIHLLDKLFKFLKLS